ncbi:hypothetical protein D8674_016741 [Pyrus ussuriensis x Pyrus communis]|uniref:ABC transporter domain-containing protein n=1 Tax=Pyrus ussuriensis x Pyrus communis TaxID=2448454 RepID=A0A5N5HFV8_9ROSA|nr:hypothetical protein D8674_016741 [Pyrus ussuriensis x Pyrus communis]
MQKRGGMDGVGDCRGRRRSKQWHKRQKGGGLVPVAEGVGCGLQGVGGGLVDEITKLRRESFRVIESTIQLPADRSKGVAIARAIMKAPKIPLLDEATSALDLTLNLNKWFQDALDGLMVDRSTVVVAHRLATNRGADLIAVVKHGVIAEKGKHETWLNIRDGICASLVAPHASA